MNNQPWAVGRGNGARMMRSAFTFLLTSDRSYADPVRTELLNLVAQPGLAWSNASKWCTDSSTVGGGNQLEMTAWMNRLIFSYDYLIAGGYTGFSAQEKTNILNWLRDMAVAWDTGIVYGAQNYWAYPGIFNTPQDFTYRVVDWPLSGPLYFNGPNMTNGTYSFSNQGSGIMSVSMAVGLLTNNATLIDHAKKLFTAYIKAGTFDNGAMPDFIRWIDCSPGCPGSMWGHAGSPLAALIQTADMYARAGNTSLYDLMTPNVTVGQTGATVGLRTTVKLWADMANKTVNLYGTYDGGDLTPGRRLTWDSDVHNASWAWRGNYYDFVSMAANMYYKDAAVRTAMTRNLKGGNDQHNGCNDSQFGGCFNGVNGSQWPDLPFMYGNMEGKVNPYGGSRGVSVSLTESPSSITSGQSSTLSWFSSDVTSCTASGGWTGSKATSGTQTVSPTQTTTYTLTCTGSGGTASASAEVTVVSPLTQVRINSGGPAYTGADGTYEADRYASGENTYNTTESHSQHPGSDAVPDGAVWGFYVRDSDGEWDVQRDAEICGDILVGNGGSGCLMWTSTERECFRTLTLWRKRGVGIGRLTERFLRLFQTAC